MAKEEKDKNKLLRGFMRNNLLSQAKFAKGAGIDPGHFCEMLKHDMTRAEQQELIDKYKEAK